MFGALLFGTIFLFSTIQLVITVFDTYLAIVSHTNWKEIKATIKKIDIKTFSREDKEELYYDPPLIYSYQVHGKIITGSSILFKRACDFSKEDLLELGLVDQTGSSRLMVGDKISVFYNPKRPSQSVFSTINPKECWFSILVYLAISIFSATMVVGFCAEL